jgi:outer membrane protein assembly factor BamB
MEVRSMMYHTTSTAVLLSLCFVVSVGCFNGSMLSQDIMPVALADEKPTEITSAAHDDWTSFRNGPTQSGIATSSLPNELEVVWEYETHDGVPSSAAIVDGHVYVGALDGKMFCFELKTGKVVWEYLTVDKPDPKSFAPGFKSSPAVSDEAIFAGDEEGVFHAIDRKTGKKLWVYATGAEVISSANFYGDLVLFGSYDNNLYALNRKTGDLVWKVVTEGYVNCSPAIIDDKTFIAGCDEHLRVVDLKTGQQVGDLDLGTYLTASPSVMDDTIYMGTDSQGVLAVNWKTLTRTWAYVNPERNSRYESSTAVNDKYVVIGGSDKLIHAIDRATGKKIWTAQTRAAVNSSPVIVDNERVFVGGVDSFLYELKLVDGTILNKFPIGRNITASPAVGENYLVLGANTTGGKIICFGKK